MFVYIRLLPSPLVPSRLPHSRFDYHRKLLPNNGADHAARSHAHERVPACVLPVLGIVTAGAGFTATRLFPLGSLGNTPRQKAYLPPVLLSRPTPPWHLTCATPLMIVQQPCLCHASLLHRERDTEGGEKE